ncbi:Fasciclin-like arabinogalactan protein 14 [Linum grandiflorum]
MASTHLIILLFLAIATSSSAFNVTNVLGPLSEFSTFSNYLAQAGVVPMMADLNNVTILAVDNANMGPISGKSRAEIERIMTMHVIPEYYDLHRLNSLPNGTALIRTVYAQTRLARGKDGMLLVTKKGKMGRFNFASAILPRSKPGVNLVKSVVVLSRNISVFHVSGLIVTPPPVSASSPKKSPAKAPSSPKSSNSTSGGKKGKSPAPTPSSDDDSSAPAPSKKKSDGPSPATSKDAPAKSPKKAKSSAPSPSDSSEDTSAPSKSSGGGASSSPSSDSPSSASSPSDEATSNSSPPAPPSESDSADADADSPSADSPAAEAPAPSGTAAPRTVSSSVGILMMAMALWALAA